MTGEPILLTLSFSLKSFSKIASGVAILVGLLVLIGWIFGVAGLKSVIPGLATMKANTALAFILAGLSLWLFQTEQPVQQRRVAQASAFLVALVALLTLTEYLSGYDLGIDQLLFKDSSTATTSNPGRMALATALNFLLLGAGLLLLDFETRRSHRPAQWFTLAAGLISVVAIIGYAYDVQSLYRIGAYSSVALNTALMFLVLSVGILCARPDRGLMELISSDTVGGLMVRRLLPAGIGVLIGVGWLRLAGQRAGLYDTEFGLSLMVVSVMTTLTILIWLNALALNRVERSLRASEARKGAILESALDCIITMNHEGKILEFNPAAEKTFGYTREKIIGKEMAELIIPLSLRERHRSGLQRYLNTGESSVLRKRIEMKAMRADGSEFPCELSIVRIGTETSPIFTGFIRDIALQKGEEETRRKNEDLKEQYHRVQEANRLKSEFLANMSHELRTPLNAIIGFAELMHDGKVGPVSSDHKEYLGDILTSARHLLQLINDVLDLSKVEAGKMELKPEPVHLTIIIGEVRQILQTLAAHKRLTVETETAPAVDQVIIDPGKFKQVLYNYLSNAIKFTPERGQIKIRTLADKTDFFRLEVQDTGIGIAPHQMDKLFTEFQQLDAGASKRHQGTGLGLALTKKIVEAQGGHVGVRSTPGQGNVFYAVLPKITAAKTETSVERHMIASPGSGRPNILVMEDNEKDRQWIAKIL